MPRKARKKSGIIVDPKNVWTSKTIITAMIMEAMFIVQSNTELFTPLFGDNFYKILCAAIPLVMMYMRFVTVGQVTLRKPDGTGEEVDSDGNLK